VGNTALIDVYAESGGIGAVCTINMSTDSSKGILEWASHSTETILIVNEPSEVINTVPGKSQCVLPSSIASVIGVWSFINGQRGPVNLYPTNLVDTVTDQWSKLKEASGAYIFAIRTAGTLWIGGSSFYNSYSTLVRVTADTDWVECSGDGNHFMAIKSDGSLWGFGSNQYRQLGTGDGYQRNEITRIGVDNNWAKVYVDGLYTLALKADGSLWIVGHSYTNTVWAGTTDFPFFTKVHDGPWEKIVTIGLLTLGIKTDGTLWHVGEDIYLNNTLSTDFPYRTIFGKVGSDTDWKDIWATYLYNSSSSILIFAIKDDGSLWACGTDYTLNLAQVGTASWKDFFIKNDGTLWTLSGSSLVQVGTDSDWKSGHYLGYDKPKNGIFLKVDNTLWTTGPYVQDCFYFLGGGGPVQILTATQSSTSGVFSGKTIDLNTFVTTGTELVVDFNRPGSVRNTLTGVTSGEVKITAIAQGPSESDVGKSVTITIIGPPPPIVIIPTYQIDGPAITGHIGADTIVSGVAMVDYVLGPFYLNSSTGTLLRNQMMTISILNTVVNTPGQSGGGYSVSTSIVNGNSIRVTHIHSWALTMDILISIKGDDPVNLGAYITRTRTIRIWDYQ